MTQQRTPTTDLVGSRRRASTTNPAPHSDVPVARTVVAVAILTVSSLTGCLSVPSENGSGPDASTSGCKNVDLCSLLTLGDVNAALGGPFDDIEPGFQGDMGPDLFSDSCWYWRLQKEELIASRSCFVDTGVAAASFGATGPYGGSTLVSGVGDRAFFGVRSSDGGIAPGPTLDVLQGHVVISLVDMNAPVRDNAEEGLTLLAQHLLHSR